MTVPRDDRLPKGIAAEHVGFIAHERDKGSTWETISLTVGVSAKTLSSWWAKRDPREPRQYVPKDARPPADRSRARPRSCLRCKIMFDSEGPHNRMCNRCRWAD
jgi:hypothetical protein